MWGYKTEPRIKPKLIPHPSQKKKKKATVFTDGFTTPYWLMEGKIQGYRISCKPVDFLTLDGSLKWGDCIELWILSVL